MAPAHASSSSSQPSSNSPQASSNSSQASSVPTTVMGTPQRSAPEGAPKHVFRSKNFSYDYFPWSPNFSNYSRETSSEARRFDTWDKALKDMDSMIFNSNHMYQCHDRAAEIPIAPYRYWCGDTNKLGSKFPDWQKEIQDLETRVWVVETREAYKTLGIDPGLVWVPPGYVEEAPEAGAQ